MLIIFVMAADYVMDMLGYVRLTFIDLLMCFDSKDYKHMLVGFFEIEKIKFKEFEKMFYERAILNIRKFSQIRVNIWGIYYQLFLKQLKL